MTERIQKEFGYGDQSENGQMLLNKTVTHINAGQTSAQQNFNDFNYKKNFYARYCVHNEAFKKKCYERIDQKINNSYEQNKSKMNREEVKEFFNRKLMRMQGNVSSKGNVDD